MHHQLITGLSGQFYTLLYVLAGLILEHSIIADDGFLKIAFIKKDLSPFEAGGGLLAVIGLGKDRQATQQEHS